MAENQRDGSSITTGRIIVWIIVAGIGVFLVATGVAGIIAKG